MCDIDIRFDILSWMETKKVFTLEDLSNFVDSVEQSKRDDYVEIIIEFLDASLVVSKYGFYTLSI